MSLQLPDAEFWELTFKEFRALQDRWMDQQRREDMRFGLLLSQQHNMNRGEKGKVVGPEDFFPSLEDVVPKKEYSHDAAKWANFVFAAEAKRKECQAASEI